MIVRPCDQARCLWAAVASESNQFNQHKCSAFLFADQSAAKVQAQPTHKPCQRQIMRRRDNKTQILLFGDWKRLVSYEKQHQRLANISFMSNIGHLALNVVSLRCEIKVNRFHGNGKSGDIRMNKLATELNSHRNQFWDRDLLRNLFSTDIDLRAHSKMACQTRSHLTSLNLNKRLRFEWLMQCAVTTQESV